ncbi:hypothetical protein M2S00_06895 [Apilactobacillus sp. TMW 2.2459]|uniref:hypothetical protein n=1 Tax=Apilactobacillus xinyiensis TaxID=2841032 RepID=UPI00200CCD5C|nr:hypothetical protein [Apilactobacillus xinyiensis]MCL0312832.1 hypothetical protein [Apilactobacillus xinyiensis]
MDNYFDSDQFKRIQKMMKNASPLMNEKNMKRISEQYNQMMKSIGNRAGYSVVDVYNENSPSLKKSLESIKKLSSGNDLEHKFITKDTVLFFDNVRSLNNKTLNSRINRMANDFGYPGENLSPDQENNIRKLESNFSLEEIDNAFSEIPNIIQDGQDNSDLNNPMNANPSSDVDSKIGTSGVPKPKENDADDFNNVGINSDDKNLESKSAAHLFPWLIAVKIANSIVSNSTNPSYIIALSTALLILEIMLENDMDK